jgi:hypothetical protein
MARSRFLRVIVSSAGFSRIVTTSLICTISPRLFHTHSRSMSSACVR